MEKLPVIFRIGRSKKDAGYGVTAVFPSFEEGPSMEGPSMAVCYAHVGQHSACSRAWYRTTRFTTTEEYKDLLAELTRIYDDYELKGKHGWTRSRKPMAIAVAMHERQAAAMGDKSGVGSCQRPSTSPPVSPPIA